MSTVDRRQYEEAREALSAIGRVGTESGRVTVWRSETRHNKDEQGRDRLVTFGIDLIVSDEDLLLFGDLVFRAYARCPQISFSVDRSSLGGTGIRTFVSRQLDDMDRAFEESSGVLQ